MKRLATIVLLFLAACATTTQNAPNADVLLQRDREFAKQSAARGHLAWQEFMAPNAAKPANGGRILIGPQEMGSELPGPAARLSLDNHGKLGRLPSACRGDSASVQ